MLNLAFLLLPVAAASGWLAAQQAKKKTTKHSTFRYDYFRGLNYLINEQPDKAVDVFIKMVEIDSETVETHLALGNLFRRRGEVDRAIRIHQNIIARPQLNKKQRVHALSELGQDYMRAGVLDRAEGLFTELVEMGEETISSLRYLLAIYEQQKDWQQAIAIAKRLEAITVQDMSVAIAHYYCELAEELMKMAQYDQAQRVIKQALAIDRACVRASLLQGKLEQASGNSKSAIKAYRRIVDQDPEYASEIVKPLRDCYQKTGDESELIAYFQSCLTKYPRMTLVLALSDYLRHWRGDKEAIEFIAAQIRNNLSFRGLRGLIDLYLDNSQGDAREKLLLLRSLVDKLLEDKPVYRCTQCGFGSKELYWQCPACKNWNVIKPIHGLEGD